MESCLKKNKNYRGNGECGEELPTLLLSSPESLIECTGYKHKEASEMCRFPTKELIPKQEIESKFIVRYTFDSCFREPEQQGLVASFSTESESRLVLTSGVADRSINGTIALTGKGPLIVSKADVFYRIIDINRNCKLVVDEISITPVSP